MNKVIGIVRSSLLASPWLFSFCRGEFNPVQLTLTTHTDVSFMQSFKIALDKTPGLIFYHYSGRAAENRLKNILEEVSKLAYGYAHVGSVNCDKWKALCDSELGSEPLDKAGALYLYPTFPMPKRLVTNWEAEKLVKRLQKLIPAAKLRSISDEAEARMFLQEEPGVPKVFVFTKKTSTPPVLSSLISRFDDRINFALCASEAVSEKLGVKPDQWPAIVLKKGSQKLSARNVDVYRGELKYEPLFKFLNLAAETFVKGGGYVSSDELKSDQNYKPWLYEEIPEVTARSFKEICSKSQKQFCIIFVLQSADEVEKLKPLVREVRKKYSSSKNNYKFMWLSTALAKLNDLDQFSVIGLRSQRGRYTSTSNAVNSEMLTRFLETIEAGASYAKMPDLTFEKNAEL